MNSPFVTSHKNLHDICDNMDGPGEYHAKWNKSEGKRQIPYDFTHMWTIKKQPTNKQSEQSKSNKNRYKDTETRGVVTRGEGGEGEMGKRD